MQASDPPGLLSSGQMSPEVQIRGISSPHPKFYFKKSISKGTNVSVLPVQNTSEVQNQDDKLIKECGKYHHYQLLGQNILLTDSAHCIVFRCVVTSLTGTRVVRTCAVLYSWGTVIINSARVTNLSCKISKICEIQLNKFYFINQLFHYHFSRKLIFVSKTLFLNHNPGMSEILTFADIIIKR